MRLGRLTGAVALAVAVLGAVVVCSATLAIPLAMGLGLTPRRLPTPTPTRDDPRALAPLGEDPPLVPGSAHFDIGVTKQKGVALGLFAEDVSFSYAPLLGEIAALGATHVALVVPIYQSDVRATDLALHTRFSPTLGVIADAVRAARRDGLEVMLFPIVRLSRSAPGQWRGTLAPGNPDRWFRAYGEVLGDLAAVAAQTGATRLAVGSELSSLDGDLPRWRALLERIRAIFPGRLVYSANWDHYRDARVLDLVDDEGVVGYFSLRADPRAPATEVALQAAWRNRQAELLAWHQGRPHPWFFSEVGYRSRAGATASPWDETPGGTPDLDEQRRAFAAFRRVWAGVPSLDGAYVWNWYGWGGADSTSYTPRGKPATDEVRRLLADL